MEYKPAPQDGKLQSDCVSYFTPVYKEKLFRIPDES